MAYRNKKFGERLEKLIKENGFSNEKVAGDVGLSPSTIGKYINDGRVPDDSILNKIADVLGTTAKDLRYGKKNLEIAEDYDTEALKEGAVRHGRTAGRPYAKVQTDWQKLLESFNLHQWQLAGHPERRKEKRLDYGHSDLRKTLHMYP